MELPSLSDVFGDEPQNQSSPFPGRNLFNSDPLIVAMSAGMSEKVRAGLSDLGAALGTSDSFQLATLANTIKPILKTHNERGRRIDNVEFHPAYHALMRRSVANGLQGSVWDSDESTDEKGFHHQARAIRFYLTSQVESGHLYPLSTTNAAPAVLRHNQALARDWLPRIRSRTYDPSQKSAHLKSGVTIGVATAEKQGGTDVNMIVTRAERQIDDIWTLTGHKWFMSAPMCDAFLVLAKTPNGLSCFFMPRCLPDGTLNNIRLLRLKDKLGNISNASSEVEFHAAGAHLVGAEGHGARTMHDMVVLTRLDSALGSAGMMRSALAQIVHHSRQRQVFETPIVDKPLATRVMADMALDCAAATVLSLRLAEAFDRAPRMAGEALFAKLMSPVVKYWVCKATPAFMAEAIECLGANGCTEDWPLARLYREAPMNAIWEGSGNILCLDVLRILRSSPQALEAVLSVVEAIFGSERKSLIEVVRKAASVSLNDEGAARILVEQLALTVAAAELHRIARSDIANAFLEGRLGKGYSTTYGMIDTRFDARSILEAMYPDQTG